MDVQNIINSMLKLISSGDLLLESNSDENQDQNIRFSNILKIIEELYHLKNVLSNLSSNDDTDIILSVSQCAAITKCIDFIVLSGFIPCLIPSIWNSFENKQNNLSQFKKGISPNKNYEDLKFIINSFFDLIKLPILKRIIIAKHANVLLAGLCQLCLFPIVKPGTEIAVQNAIDELKYEQLVTEQQQFKTILKLLILKDRDPLVIRELIFIFGNKKCNKHLKLGLGKLFSDLLLEPNGIQTFLKVACDLIGEKSQNFCQHGLQEWSNLIHSYYTKSKIKYIQYIKPQIWELLQSNTKLYRFEFKSIAVFCIHLISIENYNDFLTYYINPVNDLMKRSKLVKEENTSVSQCIEDLHTLFYLFRNEMWCLDPKLLTHIAVTIYNIYMATLHSLYYLKSKLEDLIFLILVHFSNCKDHLKLIVFSQYQIDIEYDGENIKIKYIERENQLHLESEINLILDLINKRQDKKLMKTLFLTFLDMYTCITSNEYTIMEKLFIVKGIHHLIENDDVQNSISTETKVVLNLVKSILKENSKEKIIDIQIFSIVLVVLGCVLENIDEQYISELDCLVDYLQKIGEVVEDHTFKTMVFDMQKKIKQVQNNCPKNRIENQRTIDDVLIDARDPLLPCRSHALIELKKMINSGNKTVLTKKSEILIIIQENLKNSDSYLYMSAIFTLSSFCSFYPNDILAILCEQYSMPKNYNHSPETRLKIGEVLMKTVKLLNEITPSYKNLLLNTFMAGVRDDDHLVRASSLSNLADICRLLRYSLGSIVAEIVNCADNVLRYDPAIEPRRAAVLLLQMIIEGGNSELLEILTGSIKDIYQILKFQYQSDRDATIKLHAQVAIEKLNDIMKSLVLNEKNSMQTYLK
ncbi:Armadillo-type fold,RNA polymerase II assembly factor Rtp1, C-terminal,Armadillo-like helical [Cinara cedri]|uniref:Armadillo-type fold,RNA polymerase II assembly factor Rtp1, C-terminal,Armadillo-like helical n=1 Tax=Cinara cedri TaxID=506608 RepID=A0A5E4M3Y2_9HEMI|nr:Armadillo-type fold,RNA polymerase II assembly factor Rtp1, C-terminal,Armadillo-like helical [Cinara cedri]